MVTEDMAYFEKTVENGDTVLTIIEHQLGQSLPVPISEVVTDFQKLNNDLPPQQIQLGKKYKFPDYSQAE
jgi:Tfp pilus assembly PilM family ATPase